MIRRWLARRKMRWAVREVAGMDGFTRADFRTWMSVIRHVRRFNNYIANASIRVTSEPRDASP